MKPIEDAFSFRGFRGVVLPGIVITIGIHPIIRPALAAVMSGYDLAEWGVILVAEVVFWGLIVSSATNWIYYVYEGFRLSWVTLLLRGLTEKHFSKQTSRMHLLLEGKKLEQLSSGVQFEVLAINEGLLDFPLRLGKDGKPERYVDRPTRLGNIIATYELYPETRYGVDGVFYWFHILGCAPDAAKAEFDDQYAFAESLVVTSFAGVIVAVVNAISLLGFLIGSTCRRCVVMSVQVSALHATTLFAFGLLVFFIFYRLALPVHREAGKMFRALVDLSMGKFKKWANATRTPLDPSVAEKARSLRDYLNSLIGS